MLNVETDKKVTSVIFQKSAAGKEILTVKPSIPAEVLKVCEMNQVQLVTRVEGADKNSQQMLDEGQMIVEQSKRIIDGENFDVLNDSYETLVIGNVKANFLENMDSSGW